MKPQTKTLLARFILCLFVTATTITLTLTARYQNSVIYYSACVSLTLILVAQCVVDAEKHPHLSRTLTVLLVSGIALCAAYILYYATGLDKKITDFDALKTLIQKSGFWGFAVFIGLTVFEIVVLPIPSAITIMLGVALFGATVSFILSVIGTMIGSLIAFMLGKVFGRRLCNWMFGAEQTEKYAKLVAERGRFLFIIMLLFPAFPDDMLCMIAGITSMSYLYFTVVCLLTRPVMIGITAYLGSGIIPFEGWGIRVWVGLCCLVFVLFVVLTGIKNKIESGAKFKKTRARLQKKNDAQNA